MKSEIYMRSIQFCIPLILERVLMTGDNAACSTTFSPDPISVCCENLSNSVINCVLNALCRPTIFVLKLQQIRPCRRGHVKHNKKLKLFYKEIISPYGIVHLPYLYSYRKFRHVCVCVCVCVCVQRYTYKHTHTEYVIT
jgi:hypothetical protein